MRPSTWGDIVKKRVRRFLEELLLLACGEKQNGDIQIKWEDENNLQATLLVKSKRRFLEKIADLTQENFYETIRQLKELKILEDRRMNTKGAEEWYFILKLWSSDINKNLTLFDQEWENRRAKGNNQETAELASQKFEPMLTEFEIEREEEDKCLKTILKSGSFLRIKGPQGMGKTRLLNRVLAKAQQARQDDCQIVILNWQNEFDSTAFNSYDKFLENFCAAISKYLGILDKLDKHWNQRGSPNSKTTGYFSDYILPKIESLLVLVLEEMDRVFDYPPIANDFCALLRGLHDSSQRDKRWQKLNLVIVHSTDRYASLDIPNSPLANLEEPVTIAEFTRSEVDNLVKEYNLSLTSEQVEKLMNKVNGHPFLVNHAFKKIARESLELEEILAKAATPEGIYHDHLLRLWNILKDNPPLKEAFQKVVTESTPVPLKPDILFKLERLGLVRINGNCASPRCELYRQYFATHL